MKCPSCDGAGYVIQDEEPCHMSCGSCAGTGNGFVAEAARGIHDAMQPAFTLLQRVGLYPDPTRNGKPLCVCIMRHKCLFCEARDASVGTRKRRETIARFVASALGAQERSE